MTLPDHVALVVPRLEHVLERLAHLSDLVGPIEEFPGEGTREVYVGAGAAKLLLLEPLSDRGPYGRALAKRGPGLHHVALHTPDLADFLQTVRGWSLHPASAATIERSRTVWLSRRGVPTLIEVQEAPPASGEALVAEIALPVDLAGLSPCAGLSRSPNDGIWLKVDGARFEARALASGASGE